MSALILKLNKAGSPSQWVDFQSAATTIAKGMVVWSMGTLADTLRGGHNKNGDRSFLDLPSIIAVEGKIKDKKVPGISNSLLFARDQNLCLYCGNKFRRIDLSRDHVMPRSRGGPNTWQNCVTSCKRCNHAKNDRTPEEAGMELLAIPYAPTLNEWFALSNRKVLADQMDYLRSGFKNLEA